MSIKKIKFVFLFLAAFASSGVAETVSNSHPKEHRGFYNSFDVGISYINFESHDDDARYQDKVTFGRLWLSGDGISFWNGYRKFDRILYDFQFYRLFG